MINNDEWIARKLKEKSKVIDVALGKEKADLVIKNARYVNVFTNDICEADIAISGKYIAGIGSYEGKETIDATGYILIPGLIDSHIHLESSLVMPFEFAKAAAAHGTTTVVADPHEIANVMGVDGIKLMMEASKNIPIGVKFMLSSCVPSTPLDETGFNLDADDLEPLFADRDVVGLAEMMNYPGVISKDKKTLEKILLSIKNRKKIDGHAPELSGRDLMAYIASGIYSDHECATFKNALEKLNLGQFIMIREGTAAKNLDALLPLLNEKYADRCLFATDDEHPNDILRVGEIDNIIRKAIKKGVDPILAIKVGTLNAANYFNFNSKGAIAPGLTADIVFVNNLKDFEIKKTFKRGKLVFDSEKSVKNIYDYSSPLLDKAKNTFNVSYLKPDSFKLDKAPVIGLIPNEIVTEKAGEATGVDINNDILKVCVVERHHNTGHIGLGYIKGYGLKDGAVATSIAHDSHNIIVVGTNDDDIAFAVNRIIESKGGIVVCQNCKVISEIKLPIAGLISDKDLNTVDQELKNSKEAAYKLGVYKNIDPFMTLSFMSLPVIPKLKVTTQGVFDVENWKYC